MFPNDPQSEAFPLYEYTILDEAAISINWSPSNDLCVLVHQDSSLAVCRAGITPIWSTSTLDSAVTCVTWHPNGQEFVFGCQNGTVYELNTAHLTPDPVLCWPPPDFDSETYDSFGISSLLWIDYTPNGSTSNVTGFDPNAFDMEDSFPGLSMRPPEEPKPLLQHQRPKEKPLPERSTKINKTQSLLLIGDENGSIHLCLNGGSHIATIPCVHGSSMGSIINIDISQDLDRTHVLARANGTNEYNLITLDTMVLRQKKSALCNVAYIEQEIDYLLQYIKHCANILESHHAAYTNLATKNADKIAMNSKEANDDAYPLPEVELLGLLATGNLNPAVHDYLNEQLDQQKAKQWESKAMHSYTHVQRITIEYLQPACEQLLFQLSKLRGYGLWTERYGELICNDNVNTAIKLTQQYLWTSQQLVKSVGQVSRRFQEFIAWILRVVQRIEDQAQTDYQGNTPGPLYQSPKLIMEYLMHDFVKDSLANYFKDPESTEDGTSMERNDSISIAALPSTLSKLIDQCNRIAGSPESMPRLIKHLDSIQLNLGKSNLSSGLRGRSAAFHMVEDTGMVHQYYAFIKYGSNVVEQVYLVHLFWEKATNQENDPLLSTQPSLFSENSIGKEYCLIDVESNWCVTDIEFLDNKELALLTENDDQDIPANTLLAVVEYRGLYYHDTISNSPSLNLADLVTRYMELPNMHQPVVGTNGREKRRIMAVAASNGLLHVMELDKHDDEDDDDDMDENP